MTDKLRQAAEMALETLDGIAKANWRNWEELASPDEFERWAKSRANHAAEVMRQALEQPEQGWQGLTDEEIAEGARQSWVDKQAFESAVWWAEEKLMEKNT